jgi:hypothetical protein
MESPDKDHVEPILVLLAVMMMFLLVAMFFSEHFFPNDGQMFQVVCGLLTGISGAFLGRIKPPSRSERPGQSGLAVNLPQEGHDGE